MLISYSVDSSTVSLSTNEALDVANQFLLHCNYINLLGYELKRI